MGRHINNYDQSLHILLYSTEYEIERAKDLGVPYKDFKGTTKEAMSPIELSEETLNIDLLENQYFKK